MKKWFLYQIKKIKDLFRFIIWELKSFWNWIKSKIKWLLLILTGGAIAATGFLGAPTDIPLSVEVNGKPIRIL